MSGAIVSDDDWPAESQEDADLIDDPEALRQAEMAAAAMEDRPTSWAPTDSEWVAVATAPSGAAWSLEELRGVLESEGVPAAYDPYDPREAVTLPYGLQVAVQFRVIVPAERLGVASSVVAELASEGAAWTPLVPGAPAVTEAYVALGSNLGDRVGTIAAAVREIAAIPNVHVLDVSRVVESEPWGIAEQPAFANAVARLDVPGEADAFLDRLKDIEARLGRVAGERNGPRAIDLDILLFGDEEWDSAKLTVPHPRMLERDFVVTPLLEIAPDAALPDGTRVTRQRAVLGRVVGDLGAVPGFSRTG